MRCWVCRTSLKRAKAKLPLADIVDPAKRSEMMAGIGAKNTKPELVVRRVLHRLGYRFRLHRKDLPGKPDIVLPKWRTVIFVHGCFWHGHDDCPIFRLPKSRTEFWEAKIRGNQARDARRRFEYRHSGWAMVEVWECALKGPRRLSVTEFATQLMQAIENDDGMPGEIRGQTR